MATGGWRRALRIDIGRRKVERDVDQEIAFHLEMKARKLMARGLDADLARAKALEEFGNLSAVRDRAADDVAEALEQVFRKRDDADVLDGLEHCPDRVRHGRAVLQVQ